MQPPSARGVFTPDGYSNGYGNGYGGSGYGAAAGGAMGAVGGDIYGDFGDAGAPPPLVPAFPQAFEARENPRDFLPGCSAAAYACFYAFGKFRSLLSACFSVRCCSAVCT